MPRDANFFTLFNFTNFFPKSLEMLVSRSSQQMGQNLLHLKLSESKGRITLCDLFFRIDAPEAIRYESTSLNRIVADKSHRVNHNLTVFQMMT